jgi:hypothetical protein
VLTVLEIVGLAIGEVIGLATGLTIGLATFLTPHIAHLNQLLVAQGHTTFQAILIYKI